MGMIKEFKEFAMRGSVIDMAVGIVIGGAFGKIVSSVVNDIIMPPIGIILGNVDFSNLAITLQAKTAETEAVTIKYGSFINTVVDFIIVAFSIFIVIKQMNRFRKKRGLYLWSQRLGTVQNATCLSILRRHVVRTALQNYEAI